MNRVCAQNACAIPTCVSIREAAVCLKPAVIFHPLQLLSIHFGHPVNPQLHHQVVASFHLENKFSFNVNCIHKARTLSPDVHRLIVEEESFHTSCNTGGLFLWVKCWLSLSAFMLTQRRQSCMKRVVQQR
jgi:hypothetical protein